MSFPTSPVDGAITTVNNVTYVYSSAKTAWTRANTTLGLVNNTITMANLILNSGNASVNTSTGALTVFGGAGISGNINAGGNISLSGVNGALTSAAGTNGNILIDPDGSGYVVFTGPTPVVIQNAAASISSTTGALVISGGLGLAGNLYVGGNINIGGNIGGNIVSSNITLADNSYINSATIYDLDYFEADGFTNTFSTLYNQTAVTFTSPWQLMVTSNGAVQPAFDNNYDTVWFGSPLIASRGYTIDTTGNIKFAICPARGSVIMARTVVGSPNPTKKVYPFKPLDILLGI